MASDRSLTATDTIDMLILGKTGTGKSATGNSILGRRIFKVSGNATSETANIKSEWSEYTDNRGRYFVLKVTDGPGLEDTNLNSLQDKRRAYQNMSQILSECPKGIHAFLLVFRMGIRFTAEDKHALESLKKILGQDCLRKFGVVLVTGGDNLFCDEDDSEGKTFEDWCRQQEGELKLVMQECDNRCVLFDNRTRDEEVKKKQRGTLLDVVLQIMSKNNGELYTNDNFKQYEKSHRRLMKECGLTNMKEEFRKQLSILQGEVCKVADSNGIDVARGKLQALLGQVDHELPHASRLKLLEDDLFELKGLLKDVKEREETGQNYDIVLKKANDLCQKMVKAASPPMNPEWLDMVIRGASLLGGALSIAGVAGGPFVLAISGTALAGIAAVATTAMGVVRFKHMVQYHY